MDAVMMSKLNKVQKRTLGLENLSLGHRLAQSGISFVQTAWHWAVTNSKRAGSASDSFREPVNNGFRKVII